MKRILAASAVLLTLVASSASAGGTKLRSGLAPIDDSCDGGICNWNFTQVCTTNADCEFGTVSPASKVSLSGDGILKLKVVGVTDAAGLPASGEYIYYVALGWDLDYETITIKVPLVDGKAVVEAEVGSFMGAAGSGVSIPGSTLFGPPTVPGDCPGDNSPGLIAARQPAVNDCTTGRLLASTGFLSGGKGGWKSNLVSLPDSCGAGNCVVNSDEMCTTNADCAFGSTSPKSKVAVGTDGVVKVKVSGVVDGTGAPAGGAFLVAFNAFSSSMALSVEVPVVAGKGKAAADLSSLLPPEGGLVLFSNPWLVSPTATPADCPSGNDVATVVARGMDPDCGNSVELIGVGGVAAE